MYLHRSTLCILLNKNLNDGTLLRVKLNLLVVDLFTTEVNLKPQQLIYF